MKRFRPQAYAALAAAVLASPAAYAQSFRAYLASYGNDGSAGCPLVAPCRLLPAALNAVASNGEIWILDSANFNGGLVDVAKSVSILAIPGATASIVAFANFPALTVSAAGVKVSLRNLVIANNATNPGTYGVQLNANSELSVEDCVFSNIVFDALNVNAGKANVRNSMFRDSGSFAVSAYAGATVNISGSQLYGGYGGVDAQNNTAATTLVNVTDTSIAGQTQFGVHAVAINGTSKIIVTRSTISGVGSGGVQSAVYAQGSGGSGVVMLANSTIAGNFVNISQNSGGTVRSLGNNHIGDAGAADVGTLTPVAAR